MAERILDLRDADPFDRLWRVKLRWLLDAYERKLYAEAFRVRCLYGITQANNPELDPKSVPSVWKSSNDDYQQLRYQLLPWTERPEVGKSGSRAGRQEAIDLWKARWGDPNSPETKAKIQRTIEAMRNEGKPAPFTTSGLGRRRNR